MLALSIGGVVCIAASNGGTTSQDLKTGFLIGGTPRWQQWAIIVGALTSAVVHRRHLVAVLPRRHRLQPARSAEHRSEDPNSLDLDGNRGSYQGQTFHVWRPKAERVKITVRTMQRPGDALAGGPRAAECPARESRRADAGCQTRQISRRRRRTCSLSYRSDHYRRPEAAMTLPSRANP